MKVEVSVYSERPWLGRDTVFAQCERATYKASLGSILEGIFGLFPSCGIYLLSAIDSRKSISHCVPGERLFCRILLISKSAMIAVGEAKRREVG